jgi:hypothetical protein
MYPVDNKRYNIKTSILIDLCNSNNDFVMTVSAIYSSIEHTWLIKEIKDTFMFNLIASPEA